MPSRYQFAPFEVVLSSRQLLHDGVPVPLGARAFDLLVCLISQQDKVVSRDELMAQVWPGLVVTDANLNVQVSSLRKLLGLQAVLTVAGRGYRFGLTVREVPNAVTGDVPPQSDEVARHGHEGVRERRTAVPGSPPHAVAGSDLVLPDQPSIVVLPFSNFSDDPMHGFFTDGLTDDIITELSRFSELFVIARNSAFTYKGRAVDVRQVSRELGVRYVLEGSVRHANQRIRVTAQLIDALSGSHLWAEKYDSVLEDIFDVQQEVAQAIVAAMAPQIQATQELRAKAAKPASLSAYSLAIQASHLQHAGPMMSDRARIDQSLALAREALALDPLSSMGWRALAGAQWLHLYFNTADSIPDALNEGLDAASHAIALDAFDNFAHTLKSLLLFMAGRAEAGLTTLRLAHHLNPNDAYTLAWLGFFEATVGNAQVAIGHGHKALRLSPRDPMRSAFFMTLSGSHFATGEYVQGLACARQALSEAPNTPGPHVAISVNLVGLGEVAQAKASFVTARSLGPALVAARLAGRWPSPGTVYYRRAHTFFQIAAGLEQPKAAAALR